MTLTAALHYARDAYTAPPGVIYGRLRVSADFFSAFAAHGAGNVVHCLSPTREDAVDLARRVEGAAPGKSVVFIPESRFEHVATCGALMIYSPKLAAFATARQARGVERAFSLCGVTHSMSGPVATRWLLDYITAPVHPWDALICTSRAARDMVAGTLAAHRDYLAQRLGVTAPKRPTLELPVIPLGIDVDRFAPGPESGAARAHWRRKLGIADDAVVALYLGRLSTRNKLNPFAMLRAAGLAAAQAPLTLVMAGQFDDAKSRDGWRQAVAALCPAVPCHFVDGGGLDSGPPIWPAGDFFVSLVDNIQETFGLAPVEAMAAGLPVVASDWDGYRDTVEDGVTGFLAPSWIPGSGDGADIARTAFEAGPPDDTHVGYVADIAQATAIDIGTAAEALARLAANPDLRERMSRSAALRARQHYDWPVVIRAYESLFEDLAAIRQQQKTPKNGARAGVPPLYPDPFVQYRGFATRVLAETNRLTVTPGGLSLPDVLALMVARGGQRHRLDEGQTTALLAGIAAQPGIGVAAAIEPFGPAGRSAAMRTVVFLMKMGMIAVT